MLSKYPASSNLVDDFQISSCDFTNISEPRGGDGGNVNPKTNFMNASSSNISGDLLFNNARDIKAADVDADNNMYLIFPIEDGLNKILLNDGMGSNSVHMEFPISGKRLDSEEGTIAYFNSNSLPDLIFANEQDRANELYINRGNGAFHDVSGRIRLPGYHFH